MARRSAFTLVELLVVVAIIALLIALMIPAIGRVREAANIVACASNQRQLATAVVTYAGEHRGIIPPRHAKPGVDQAAISSPTDFYFLYTRSSETGYSDNPSWNVGYTNLGLLYEAGLIDNGRVYYCPSMELAPLTYSHYTPWPTPGAVKGRVRGSFYYNPHTDGTGTGNGTRIYDRVSRMPRDAVLSMDYLFLSDQSALSRRVAHWSEFGWNLARPGGSVEFVQPPRAEMLATGEAWRVGGRQNWDAFHEALDLLRRY